MTRAVLQPHVRREERVGEFLEASPGGRQGGAADAGDLPIYGGRDGDLTRIEGLIENRWRDRSQGDRRGPSNIAQLLRTPEVRLHIARACAEGIDRLPFIVLLWKDDDRGARGGEGGVPDEDSRHRCQRQLHDAKEQEEERNDDDDELGRHRSPVVQQKPWAPRPVLEKDRRRTDQQRNEADCADGETGPRVVLRRQSGCEENGWEPPT